MLWAGLFAKAGRSMSEFDPRGRIAYWLALAREDLEAARALSADARISSRIIANLAQQAVEKALKAGIVAGITSAGVDPPRTHDLERLARLQSAFELPVSNDDLLQLMDAHAQGRYPEDPELSYSPEETVALIDIASAVVVAATAALGK